MKETFIEKWNDILQIWINGLLDLDSEESRNQISPLSKRKKNKKIFKEFIGDFFRVFKKSEIPKNKIWFLSLSKNNFDSLKEVQIKIPNSIFVSFLRLRNKKQEFFYYFTYSNKFFYDLIFPFAWIVYYFKNRTKGLKYYDLLFSVNGTYNESLRLIERNKPKIIIFANDHVIVSRSLLLAANKLGVKTYYIQHASVSNYFPPLAFNFSLLEGKDAHDKYLNCGGTTSKIYLVGMSKFDSFKDQINTNKKVKSLGIAYNHMDNVVRISKFIKKIKKKHPELLIITRPHPSDIRKIELPENVLLSDSKYEDAFSFLCNIDALITGDSSLHLEATLLNVYSMYFEFTKTNLFDYYGFIKNGLVDYYKTLNSIDIELNKLKFFKPDVRNKAVYYNASIGSSFEGKSTEKIVDIILNTMNL
ncbi:hypothetical protein V8G69_02230 [Gaetbulibacter sp. M235]|uniref:hypothetical protein n=1 Tax=Gaetbulibacter sp. M235 TaxID=3126510 RepID=UPI00374F25A3